MKRIAGFFKSIDQLGVPVHFTFQGEDTHKTAFGGLCSFIGLVCSWGLAFSVLFRFMNKPEYNQSIILNYLNLAVESERYAVSAQ